MAHKLHRPGVYALIMLFSACSITYELVLARLFAVLSSQEIIWHSVTIAMYVLALGVGTAWSDRLSQRWHSSADALRDLIAVQVAITFVGALSVYAIWEMHGFLRINHLPELVALGRVLPLDPVDVTCIVGQLFVVTIGVLSGLELPLLARVAGQAAVHDPVPTPGTVDTTHSKSLACNYIGTLFGTFAFLFVLAPNVGLGMAAWWTASFNLLGAIALFALIPSQEVLSTGKKRSHRLIVAGMVPALAALVVVGLREDKAEQLALKAGYYVHTKDAAQPGYRPPETSTIEAKPRVIVHRSPYQTMHIVRDARYPSESNELEPGVPFTLYLDRHFQLSSEHQALYHEFFVHYPIALLASTGVRSPTNVLVLGGGDGLAAKELLRYPQISAITQVELDPEMLKLATTNPALLALNQDSLSDPRVTVIMDDAFSFLKDGGQKYDAIFIDFPYPFTYDLSRLYSREFYTFVRRSLTLGGFVVADMPLIPKHHESQEARIVNDILSSTLRAAGFGFLAPYGGSWEAAHAQETFMIAMMSQPDSRHPATSAPIPGFALDTLFRSGINHLGPSDFEIRNHPDLVNSVFRPTLLSLRNRGL